MNTFDRQLLRELLTASRDAVDAMDALDLAAAKARRLDYAIVNFETKSTLFAEAVRASQVKSIVGDMDAQ